jgi:dUTP pyrophosphatase
MRCRDFEKISEKQFHINSYSPKYNSLATTHDIIVEAYNTIQIPRRATKKSSGYDFISPFSFILCPRDSIKINTGIKAYMLFFEELLLFPRSSVGINYKIKIDNTIGKIDSDYYNNSDNEGDIVISLTNTGDICWHVKAGDKIAQGSFYQYLTTDTDNPVKEERSGGIGSTNER